MFSQKLMPTLLSLQGFLDINNNIDVGKIIVYGVLLLGLLFIGIATSRLYPKITAIGGLILTIIGLYQINPSLAIFLAIGGILVTILIFAYKFGNAAEQEVTNTTSSQTNTNTSSKEVNGQKP